MTDGRLPLTDPRWAELGHRMGKGTERDSPDIAAELTALLAEPSDAERCSA